MSGIASDVRAPAEGSVSPASGAVPQPAGDRGLPNAYPENPSLAPMGTAVQSEGGGIGDGPPDAEPTGEEAVRLQYEEQFKADKAALESTYHKQIHAQESEIFTLTDQAYSLSQRNRALEGKIAELVEKYGGDEGDLALIRVAADDAERAASQQTAKHRETVEGWRDRQEPTHQAHVASRAVDETTGQQLFSPDDPEIQEAFNRYLPLGLKAMRSGGRALEDQATRAFTELQGLIERKREEGFRRMSGGATPGVQRSPEDNRALNDQRGPMNRGDGTNASITNESLLEEATRLYPNDMVRRQAWFIGQRRQHGLSG